jgi:hypothetical protein
VTLSSPTQLASNVRALFHSSTRKAANTGCLLEQVASHIILGLSVAVEAGTKSLLGPFQPAAALTKAAAAGGAPPGGGGAVANGLSAGGGAAAAAGVAQQGRSQASPRAGGAPIGAAGFVAAAPGTAAAAAAAAAGANPTPAPARQRSRSTLLQAAQASLGDSLGAMLRAVSLVGSMARALQAHYQRVIVPHVAGSAAEARACSAGLAALVKAADERVLAALQRTLTLLFNQVCGRVASWADGQCPQGASPPGDLLPGRAALRWAGACNAKYWVRLWLGLAGSI